MQRSYLLLRSVVKELEGWALPVDSSSRSGDQCFRTGAASRALSAPLLPAPTGGQGRPGLGGSTGIESLPRRPWNTDCGPFVGSYFVYPHIAHIEGARCSEDTGTWRSLLILRCWLWTIPEERVGGTEDRLVPLPLGALITPHSVPRIS